MERVKVLPYLYIIAITTTFFIALGKFAKIDNTISIIFSVICSIGLLLSILKSKVAKGTSAVILVSIVLFLVLPGKRFYYISRLDKTDQIDKFNINSFSYDSGIRGIDSSTFYKSRSKLSKWYDKKLWKIEDILPIRGNIYYPESNGIYPLIVIIHGNNLAEIPSYSGYQYLIKYLAHNGYIVASIDQNFLNGNWTTLGVGYPEENDVRAHLLNKHIEEIIKMNNDPKTPFFSKIDTKNIGIIGHSRGGEAAAISTTLDPCFKIRGIVSLAPTYRQYPATINMDDISYMTIHGSNDGDLRTFKGRKQYNRVRFTTSQFNLKCSYYIEAVNHNQFNSQWNKIDSTSLGRSFYSRNSTIDSKDQKEIAKVLIKNFFNVIMKKEYDKIEKLKYPLSNKTLPMVRYISDYSDSSYTTLFNFSRKDNINISTTNIEKDYVFRNNNKSLKLSWITDGSITFKTDEVISDNFGISIASNLEKTLPLEITLLHNDELLSQHQIEVEPIIEKNIMKVRYFNGVDNEYHYQFYNLKLDNKTKWNQVKIKTPKPKGSLYIDNIGYFTSHLRIE